MGGGTTLVLILFLAGVAPAVAVPVHGAVQLVSNASRVTLFWRHVDWRAFGVFFLGALPLPFLLAGAIARADQDLARLILAVFILLLTWWSGALKRLHLDGRAGMVTAGALAGGVGMVVGATGTLIAPFFLRDGWTKEAVIGTKAACQASAHLLKIVAFSTAGFAFAEHLALIVPMGVAVVAGTWTGKRLLALLAEATFRRLFRALVTVLSLHLGIAAILSLAAR